MTTELLTTTPPVQILNGSESAPLPLTVRNLQSIRTLYPHMSTAAKTLFTAMCFGWTWEDDVLSQICATCGLSKNTVRKALRELKSLGLIGLDKGDSLPWWFATEDFKLTPARGAAVRYNMLKRLDALEAARQELKDEIAKLEKKSGIPSWQEELARSGPIAQHDEENYFDSDFAQAMGRKPPTEPKPATGDTVNEPDPNWKASWPTC